MSDTREPQPAGAVAGLVAGAAALSGCLVLGMVFGAFVCLGVQAIVVNVRPQWGTNPPAPWGDLLGVLLAVPFLVWAVRRTSAATAPARATVPPLAIVVFGLAATGGFMAALREDPIPPAGMAARRLLEQVELVPGYDLVDEGDEGTVMVSPYREFVGPRAEISPELVARLPEGFDEGRPGSGGGLHFGTGWVWKGPNPFTPGSCELALGRPVLPRDAPRMRLFLEAYCE